MPRIIFLNRFFHPDHSATSQILSDLAFRLAESGRTVHVITSQQIYDDPTARLASSEQLRGVQIDRVATTRFGRSKLIGRTLDYLSFYWSMRRRLVSIVQPGDIIVAKTDPPLLSVLAIHATRRRSAYLVNWLQDLYPEIAIELGVPFLKGPIGWMLARLRNRSLRLADANVVVAHAMAERVRACGVARDRVHIISNWTQDEEIVPVTATKNPLRRQWNLEDKFVVGYSGNLGRAHEFETMLAVAEILRDDPQIVFVIIGGGTQFDELTRQVHARKLERTFRFFPYQHHTTLKNSLSVPDVHWLSLPARLEGLIFPSKLYGIAAAGRPILAITAEDGEIAELIARYECGAAIAPGDATRMSRLLVQLADDPARCAAIGRRARDMLDAEFSRRQAIEHWQQLLANVVANKS